MASPLPANPRRGYKTSVAPTSSTIQPTPTHYDLHLMTSTAYDRSLKKSATFSSPKSPASEDDPILSISLLSRRSPTSPKDLEDAVTAGEQRITALLGSVDRCLSGLETFSSESQETLCPDDHPVPRFMLGAHVSDVDHMDIDNIVDPSTPKPQERRKHHSSDSGIGSTVSDSEQSPPQDDAGKPYSPFQASTTRLRTHLPPPDNLTKYKNSIPSIINEVQSGINGTATASKSGAQHSLSAYACRQIQKYIIVPILKEEKLKDFHPLINGIPLRVGRKEITCLRDLEKVLLWLAPVSGSHCLWERSLAHCSGVQRYSVSKALFINFCETSIQCLHTTVDHLNEPDQRRPTDRPYTNGYFLDLTEQIRQYAAMITAARERMAAGKAEAGDEQTAYALKTHHLDRLSLNLGSNNKLSLEGGLGQTGRPAELVRTNENGSISLRTGEPVQIRAGHMEQGWSHETDEHLALSMARRRKAEAAVKEIQRCRECVKEFKRPCDLTKHEKTHSRPWKCDEPSCKYSEYGWPTEKERDRHVNDKHSATPSMYKCQFRPCPYESKRESNCKQHMEKAHGWAYVRSKNNGRTGRKPSKTAHKSPQTPQTMTTPGSHIFDASGSEFGESTSPYMRTSTTGETTATGSVVDTSPALGIHDTFSPSPFESNLNWDHGFPTLTPESPYTPASHRLSYDSGAGTTGSDLPSSYETSMPGLDLPLFNGTFDWSNMDTDYQNMNIQLFTPATTVDSRAMDGYHSRNPSISVDQPMATTKSNLSPGAQGHLMLFTPEEEQHVDEGFDEFATEMSKHPSDFTLFDSRPTSTMETGTSMMNLFQDLPPFNSTTWSGNPAELTQYGGDVMEE